MAPLGEGVFSPVLAWAGMVNAEEVPTGYIVTKANLASVDKQTFDGYKVTP